MKVLAWICGLLVFVLGLVYVVAFTSFGNALIKPSIEKYASGQMGMELRLEKFELGFSTFDIIATLNGELGLSAKGKYSLFTRQFDLVYSTQALSFKGMDIRLGMSGEAMGSFSNFIANGVGSLAGSNVRFASRIKDFTPLELKLDAKDLDLNALSQIALNKAALHGKISATADIVSTSGKAKITAPKITLDESFISELGISLPKDFALSLNSDIDANDGIFSAKSELKSPIGTAGAKNTSFDSKTNEITSDFSVDIRDLAKLEPIINQKLKGALKVEGNTKIANNKMEFLEAKISGLGGEIITNLKDSNLEATIKNIKLANALALVGQKAIANSDINGKASISNIYDIANIKGNAELTLSNGVLNHQQMNALLGSDLSADVSFNAQNVLQISNSIINFSSNLSSPAIENLNAKGEYKLSSDDFKLNLSAKITDLSAILGSGAKTSAQITADAELKSGTLTSANVDFKGLGGSAVVNMKGKGLNAEIKNIEAASLFAFTNLDALFSGALSGFVSLESLDANNLNGRGEMTLAGGVLNGAALSKMLGSKFPDNVKFNAHFKPTFTNSVAYFSSNLASDIGQLSKFDGSYNLNKNILDAAYTLNVNDLSALAFLTGVSLKTPLNVSGKIITQNENITATATSDIFGSKTNIKFASSTLNADMAGARIEEILKALGYDQFYVGTTNAKLNYKLDSSSGNFEADILQARLARSGFTDILSTILVGKDITKEVYENGKITGNISKNLIDFKAKLHSNRSDINVEEGKINTSTKALNIPLRANYEKTDIAVDITGTTDAPKYAISSEYLKQKAKDGIDKLIDKAFKNDDNNSKKEGAKELLKGLKNLF